MVHEIVPALEQALPNLTEQNLKRPTLRIGKILRSQQPVASNITVEERKALSKLKQNRSIHISRADKGNVTFILNGLD